MDYRRLLDLEGQVALVVGAASGIGRASAEALAAFGAKVVLADRDQEGLEAALAAVRAQGGEAEAYPLDLAARGEAEAVVERVHRDHGRLDTLVSTPAINLRKPLLDYTDEEVDRVVDLNLKGTLRLLRAGGRVMREQRGGKPHRLCLHSRPGGGAGAGGLCGHQGGDPADHAHPGRGARPFRRAGQRHRPRAHRNPPYRPY